MPEQYVIGIDGGQTGSTCLLARRDGLIVGHGTGGHLVHLQTAAGPALLRAAFQQCVGEAWRAAGLDPQPCAAVYLGLSGVESGTAEAHIAEQIAGEIVGPATISAANDATSALAGALLCRPGVVVIAGTGAIALGVNEAGEEGFSGGWGWLLGDEGSALDIGRRGLLAALHAWDGRGPATRLAARLQAHYGVAYYFDVKRMIYSSPLDARIFAELAPIVVKAAQDGDVVAKQIVNDAALELAKAAAAVISRLGFTASSIPVSYFGGVFRAGADILIPFARGLHRLEPRARVTPPALPSSCGSVLLALRACGALDEAAIAAVVASVRQRGWANVE